MPSFKRIMPCLAASSALAALSPQQIAYVFADTKGLVGGSATAAKAFEATLVANASHALVALQLLDGKLPGASATDIGWIGLGAGQSMVGSDDSTMWLDGNDWVISRREPTLQTLTTMQAPKDAGAADGDFAIVPELSSGKGGKVVQVAFLRKLDPDYNSKSAFKTWNLGKALPLVFARSSTAPKGDASEAELAYHDVAYGQVQLTAAKITPTRNFGKGAILSTTLPEASKPEAKAEIEPKPSKSKSASEAPAATKEDAPKTTGRSTKTDNPAPDPKVDAQLRNATVTTSAIDPNDTPNFCETFVNANATTGNPCIKRKKPLAGSAASSRSLDTSVASVPSGAGAEPEATAASDNANFSSGASTVGASVFFVITPLLAYML